MFNLTNRLTELWESWQPLPTVEFPDGEVVTPAIPISVSPAKRACHNWPHSDETETPGNSLPRRKSIQGRLDCVIAPSEISGFISWRRARSISPQ